MPVEIGLRKAFGSSIKNDSSVYLLEAALNTVFNSTGNGPKEQQELDGLRAHSRHLTALHEQEKKIEQELAVASYQHYNLSDASKLLAKLLSSAPDVLEQQATPVAAADPGRWLKWYKDPRSWSGYSFTQYLQDTDGASTAQSNKPGPQALRFKGPRPANVTQAVVWRLKDQETDEECEAACAAVKALQARLADTQQQQEQVYAQLTEGWRSALRAAFAPTQQPLALHLTLSPDTPAMQHMQQQLEESQVQLAAAQQEVAAARQRAKAAEAALHQQQQQVAAAAAARVALTVTVQEPAVVLAITIQQHEQQQQKQAEGSQLLALQERLAVVEAALVAYQQQQQQTDTPQAAKAVVARMQQKQKDEVSTPQQPGTPAFNRGHAALSLSLLAARISPCSSVGSDSFTTANRSCSRELMSFPPGHTQDAAGLTASGGHSAVTIADNQHQQQQQQLGASGVVEWLDCSAVEDQQEAEGLTLLTQCYYYVKGSYVQGGSAVSAQSRRADKASGSPTDIATWQSAGRMGHQHIMKQQQQQQQQQQQLEEGAGFGAGDLTVWHRGNSAGSVCGSANSRRSSTHSNSSLAGVFGGNGWGDFWSRFGTGGSGLRRLSAGGSSCGSEAALERLSEPTAAAVLAMGGPPSFVSVLAGRLSRSASLS